MPKCCMGLDVPPRHEWCISRAALRAPAGAPPTYMAGVSCTAVYACMAITMRACMWRTSGTLQAETCPHSCMEVGEGCFLLGVQFWWPAAWMTAGWEPVIYELCRDDTGSDWAAWLQRWQQPDREVSSTAITRLRRSQGCLPHIT